MQRPHSLPETPSTSAEIKSQVRSDYERFEKQGLPNKLEELLQDRYQLDVSARYAGFEIPNPWGKASGQLSMTARQVQEDVEAGLGFVVLKTVIAEDELGTQSMEAWAIKEARMLAEPIVGKSGETGWTISWKGRGWWHSFDDYLQLIREARSLAAGSGTLIVPSCKYHLPMPEEDSWKIDEYKFTTAKLLEAWRENAVTGDEVMPLEKDFSPTLAGSDRAAQQAKILEWLQTVPRLVSQSATKTKENSASGIRLGLKIFNALFEDAFQLEMLRTIHNEGADRPDFFIYGNRLFDPNREFDGHRGIAYGGPDLSDRNLMVMSEFCRQIHQKEITNPLEWSATGNITTGKMAVEYALRGASSFQLHTFFQLPTDQYSSTVGTKTQKALLELTFHPKTGFIVWMHHLADVLGLRKDPISFRDIIGRVFDVPDR